MSYTIEYSEDDRVVMIRTSGEMSRDLFAKQVQEALLLGQDKNCRKYLSDCTSMTAAFTTMDIYNLPNVYNVFSAPRTNKLAIIVSESTAPREDAHFFETVCVNRGWTVKVFEEKESALEWLRR